MVTKNSDLPMAEMLVQSHSGDISLLPVLPSDWKNGYVNGLRARGGYGLDIAWKDGKLVAAVIKSTYSGKCKLVYDGIEREISVGVGELIEYNGRLECGKQGVN